MPRPSPRRRATRPERVAGAPPTPAGERRTPPRDPAAAPRLERLRTRVEAFSATRWPLVGWWLIVAGGLGALVARLVPVGPAWLDGLGATAVLSAYAWALAARTGGRPVVFGTLALALASVALAVDDDRARTGAAALTCVVAAVLAVMATLPARRIRHAAREAVVAVLLASVGAFAAVGFSPAVELLRFEYAVLALGLLVVFLLVYRLGAGLHGLGRRGFVAVVVGGAVLVVSLAYAELLRRYGPEGQVEQLLDVVRWSREELGAFPRPVVTVLGLPALVWGCHMRARRRQGWWVCAFGVAATAPITTALMNPTVGLVEVGLSVAYGLVGGLVIGLLVVRVDLALTGPRGRRARRAEQDAAVRPEPARGQALL